jgi:hypothetical protein
LIAQTKWQTVDFVQHLALLAAPGSGDGYHGRKCVANLPQRRRTQTGHVGCGGNAREDGIAFRLASFVGTQLFDIEDGNRPPVHLEQLLAGEVTQDAREML